MNSENFNQLDETNLSKINGGSGVVTTIIIVGGLIGAADQAYKFGQGVVQGWKDHD
ncbi:ComC/BlpC family leader-containing pheromone/bacteriocin [Clostridium botulinum]|uniref:ComC/BlpC family leader-containing pheromone/bacteriocin n=1 Tax=Clostridium botulinum TaxID=1491 RepID=UPI000A702EF8|nr:ComC/BlpC family leader-containing pheromone/bacteriocin [Clostridium botulinum]MBY6951549.1 ComC/BlpC family leader-containing pheromone/bacteriocin [Clostridium botulinum]MCR1139131.1 ComC/BlpC family leader-containing pheromone/bacteriocin [Clostridium botulinum]